MISLLETGGVLKNFKYIVDDTVSMGFNVDGVHGKKSLRNLENVFSALLGKSLKIAYINLIFIYKFIFKLNILEAVSLLQDNQGPPEEQIRKALQRQKKRQFKNKCVAKPTNSGSV